MALPVSEQSHGIDRREAAGDHVRTTTGPTPAESNGWIQAE